MGMMANFLRVMILASILWPLEAVSAPPCFDIEDVDEVLKDQDPIAVGMTKRNGNRAVLLVNEEDRTWTLLHVHPRGVACVVTSGTSFDLVPLPLGDAAT